MYCQPPVNVETTYLETIEFLYSLERFGILLGLDNINSLLAKLGNPQKTFPTVHVGGSNGKGSTASFIASIAGQAGLRTALYTSPHLNDFRERVKLDGRMISKEALVQSTEKIRKVYDPERTTFFEFTTALAFDWMARSRPDLAVVEVGLGGRLDATNTLTPLVSIITDISREHEDYLGTGIAAVAGEKAGIIKAGVPVISGASRKAARRVIRDRALELGAPLKEFGRDFLGRRTGHGLFDYESDNRALRSLSLGMTGSYQIKNAAMAVAVVEELIHRGYSIPERAIRMGIVRAHFPGRFEILRRRPDVIIDGAHTVEGMRLLKSSLLRLYPGTKPLMLLGMLKDKNYQALCEIIAPMAGEVMCVPPMGNRAVAPEKLAGLIHALGIPASWSRDIIEGFEKLFAKASTKDLVLATGSLYMIGPVRRACGFRED